MSERVMSVADAEGGLKQAQDEFACADDAYNGARMRRTSALNRVNEAQRAFDAAVAAVKASAPPDTDWKRQADRYMPVAR